MLWDDATPEEHALAAEECERSRRRTSEALADALLANRCSCWDSYGTPMVTKVVLVAEVLDSLGERNLHVHTSENVTPWDAAGMFGYGGAMWMD